LLKTVSEGTLQGKKVSGRPRAMLLDTMMQKGEDSGNDCAKLKEKAKVWNQ